MGNGNRPELVSVPVSGPEQGNGRTELRVLMENGEYWLNNKGDLAILDITVRRIAERLPQARVGVLTSAPALLRAYEPSVDAIWFQRGGGWPRRSRGSRPLGLVGPELSGPIPCPVIAVGMPQSVASSRSAKVRLVWNRSMSVR